MTGVRNSAAAIFLVPDFIARAHEKAPGGHLHLIRPFGLRQKRVHIQRVGGEGRNFFFVPGDILRAHNVEPDGFGWNGHRVGVLNIKKNFLIFFTRRHACVIIGGPGIGIV